MIDRTIGSVLFPWRAFALSLCGMTLGLVATSASAAVGRTAGSFNVSSTGAATYSIPIFTPPGPRGMQPSVALIYNSNTTVGTIGRGWSLSGFSSIQRCNKTIAQDGEASAAVGWASDAYCLNGNRLRHQSGSGSYGQNASVYYTEIADFSQITGNASGYTDYGPASWTVKGKDGLIYTYGGTADSLVTAEYYPSLVVEWKVSEIADRSGNKVRFTYKTQDSTTLGTTHPTKIEWTQSSAGSGSYIYRMDFNYSASGNLPASRPYGYTFGHRFYDADLLTSITVSVSNVVKRNYVLGYEESGTTGAKRLTQVMECSDVGAPPTDCLSPTNITYQNGTAGVNIGSPVLSVSNYVDSVNGNYDFNGDGIKDLVYHDMGSSGTGNGTTVHLGTGSGYGSPISLSYAAGIGRILGNSSDQLLIASGGYWYVYSWSGSSFSATSTGITTASMSVDSVVDVDGDGLDDVIGMQIVNFSNSDDGYMALLYLNARRNTSSAGSPSFSSAVQSWGTPAGYYIGAAYGSSLPPEYGLGAVLTNVSITRGGDTDGDGRYTLNMTAGLWLSYYNRSDISEVYWFDGPLVLTGPVTFTAGLTTDVYSFAGSETQNSTMVGDLNGDGCEDFLTYDPAYGSAAGISNCAGLVGETFPSIWWGQNSGLADWNGDGKSDYFQNDGTTVWVRSVTGNGLTDAVNTGLPVSCGSISRTDANGDGLDDIVCDNYGAGLTVYQHNGTATIPDLVSRFEDGYGVRNDAVYKSISQSSVHTPSTGAALPYRDVTKGVVVVSKATASDGIGGTYDTDYTYAGARENTQGRGFMGFEKIEAVDSRSQGLKRVQKFRRDFPYAGMLVEDSTYQHDGTTLISQRLVTPGVNNLDTATNNERVFPYPASTTEDFYEVGGVKNGSWITHAAASNTFDNWGNLTASTRTTTDKDNDVNNTTYGKSWIEATAFTFTANTTYWCLRLPEASSVTYSSTMTGETSSITRSKSLTPDYSNCRHSAESVGSGDLQVDTSYGYDSFGNVSSTSVTGRKPNAGGNMDVRTTYTDWGSAGGTYGTSGTGQFPVRETNALSQTTTRTFHSTYGSLLTETDPNNVVVFTDTYDTFGRLSRVDRSDGTATTHDIYTCAGLGSCINSNNMVEVISMKRGVGNVFVRDVSAYLDRFERELGTASRVIDGTYSRTERQYDSFGNVLQESLPCSWSGGGSCSAYWITNSYDQLGRLTVQSRPQSQSASTPVTTTFAYEGRTQKATDQNSKLTTKIMDVNGRMRQSRDHDNYSQNFQYDAAGSLMKVTDSLSNDLFKDVAYSYGVRPFQTASKDMDLGSWSYTYNSLGELVSWIDAKGQTFSQTYDLLSRPRIRTDYVEGTTEWTWGSAPSSHDIGRLSGVAMADNSSVVYYREQFTYDSVGRATEQKTSTDQDYFVNYAYNAQGLLDTLTYPTSTSGTRVKVKYGYSYGIPQTVTDWTSGSAGTVYWTANTQNVRGQTTQETLGNGVVTYRNFDAVTGHLNYIQSGTSGGGSTSLQNLSYAYDNVGNVTQRQDTRSSGGLTENFCYDNLYRLTETKLGGSNCSSTTVQFTYDGMGNIASQTGVGSYDYTAAQSGCSYYSHTQKHAVRAAGSVVYCYDANGNMTKRAGSSITWSSYNYPTTLRTATETTDLYYGPDRQYYKQIYTPASPDPQETTYYVGEILEKVGVGGVTDWRHYIKADGQIVAIISRKSGGGTDAVIYPLEDNQGSGSVLTGSTGTNLARQSYEAFGAPRDGNDWSGTVPSGDQTMINGISRRGYTGHSMLGAMGLIHMNGRVQDAITGRFLSPDPYVQSPGFTQSFNRYAYVNNNAMRYIDPSGFVCVSIDSKGICTESDVVAVGQRSRAPRLVTYADCGAGQILSGYGSGRHCVPFLELLDTGMGIPFLEGTLSDYAAKDDAKKHLGKPDMLAVKMAASQGRSCIGTSKQCGIESFWRDSGLGRFLSSTLDPLSLFNDGVNPISGVWLTPREQQDAAFIGFVGTVTGVAGFGTGFELSFGRNFRVAPFGNRTGHEIGKFPHYHRRGVDAATGETMPGQGIGRHRPWETKSTDESFWDVF